MEDEKALEIGRQLAEAEVFAILPNGDVLLLQNMRVRAPLLAHEVRWEDVSHFRERRRQSGGVNPPKF